MASTATDLNVLHSMSFDTVSFEELLGHCHEVLKKNDADLLHLQHLLRYTPRNLFICFPPFLFISPCMSFSLFSYQNEMISNNL